MQEPAKSREKHKRNDYQKKKPKHVFARAERIDGRNLKVESCVSGKLNGRQTVSQTARQTVAL